MLIRHDGMSVTPRRGVDYHSLDKEIERRGGRAAGRREARGGGEYAGSMSRRPDDHPRTQLMPQLALAGGGVASNALSD